MFQLFETIKIVNNRLINLEYHNARMNRARKELLKSMDLLDLSNHIKLPHLSVNQVYKCRVVYSGIIEKIEILPYSLRLIKTLKLVECPDIYYKYKFTDRSHLERIKYDHNEADDVVIVQDGRITDCSYANIVFFDGKKWLTPATVLLEGTKRQKYIEESRIVVEDITVQDLKNFEKARIINAMIDLEESCDILPENIYS